VGEETSGWAPGGPVGRGQPSASYSGQESGWNELAEKLSELSRTLQNEHNLDSTLQAIVQAATGTVPGAEHASISSVVRRREVRTLAATGELPQLVDQAQYDTGEGPCLDSLYEHQTVRLDHLDTDTPWPTFAPRVRDIGVGSMLAIQLYVTGEDLGALNLHSTQPKAFNDESEQVGLLFAAHAAVALAGAQEQQHLHTALTSRDIIGQAKGILMERHKITAHEAFRLLVSASQTTNIKLHDIADHLTRTGVLRSPKSRPER
jgi:GAF domain-containing protein